MLNAAARQLSVECHRRPRCPRPEVGAATSWRTLFTRLLSLCCEPSCGMQYYSVCVFVLFGLVQEGCGIECFSCISRGRLDNEACVRFDKNRIPLKKCDLTELENTREYAKHMGESMSNLFVLDIQQQEPQMPMNCLKQITKVGGQEIVLRGCQLAATEQLDICVKVKEKDEDNLRTDYCSLCNSDGCNSATVAHSMSFLLVALVSASFF